MINASLGAHYSPAVVRRSWQWWWHALSGQGRKAGAAHQRLQQQLEEQFGGQGVLVYKGRDAIELALRAFGLTQGEVVLTQAFACLAIEEAIVRAGAVPGYVDVAAGRVNLSVETLTEGLKQYPQAKAVIVQYSLGQPTDIQAIAKWCREQGLMLIEDLAQSFGATAMGQPLGSFGDAVVLSFGRDKIVDAVSGGAVVFRAPPPHSVKSTFPLPPATAVLKDLAYPWLTWLIRHTYNSGIGKGLHALLKITRILTNPTHSPTATITALPESLADLALLQLEHHPVNHQHRQEIAALYLAALAKLPRNVLTQPNELDDGALLRVAFTTNQPDALLAHFKQDNIHLTDRWYRYPVDGGAQPVPTLYLAGSCPRAEQLAQTIVNLPTHAKITTANAQAIITSIQTFFAHATT